MNCTVRVVQVGRVVHVFQEIHVIQVIQVIQVVQVVQVVSLDDMHLENIWFSGSEPSNY